MPRPPARLANCYVPLPLESLKDQTSRTDRKPHELRQLCLETSVIAKALGSSLVELGHTKVLCQVSIATTDSVDEGKLECKVKFAPHVGINVISQRSEVVSPLESTVSAGRLNSQTMVRESSLSSQLHSALIPTIPLQKFPKCAISVHVTILQDDGSGLTACITAASLALVDANVEVYDMVTSCTVAVGTSDDPDAVVYLADPTEEETLRASAVICLAMTPNQKEVTLWSQSGRLDSAMANEAMELCRNGCRTMHKFMREVWVSQQMQQ
jgi:exosome complex component MTR3